MAEDDVTPDPDAEDPVTDEAVLAEPEVDEPEAAEVAEPEVAEAPDYETVIYEAPVVEHPVGVRTTAAGWALLVVVGLLALLLGAVVVHADIAGMQDPGWQDNALWAAGAGLALLGLALAAVSWTVATDGDQGFTRVAVLAAVIGVIAATVFVGVADVQAGEQPNTIVATAPAPVATGAAEAPSSPGPDASSGLIGEEPIIPAEAQDLENLTSLAQVIESRTFVTLELTLTGRRLLARAMRCLPGDFSGTNVVGVAIGGTWVQPLVAVEPPRRGETPIQRCHQAVVRLPVQAGLARPA
jgi:hypothetical protein